MLAHFTFKCLLMKERIVLVKMRWISLSEYGSTVEMYNIDCLQVSYMIFYIINLYIEILK